ncbi:TrmH family RNA methyltransferase [Chitinophaga nivalis]|uniref:RNA methyltransferase n=1 Tax=Chitinophaga nivalis TaxID=2991709 RepID=A0ABT3IF58_9BACT|nr:RNA methyltransferase [Chitinophaga nivalis]MCW3467716.1 RNA methyltransferase [Chitinophaga nivalis]MCW3482592.1 RNA methyltransferase [Chitinophaga nivalis]
MLSKAQIKYIQSLQHKKNRQKSSQYIAEGDKIVQELLQAGMPVKAVYATADWLEQHHTLLAKLPAVTVTTVDTAILKQLSSLTTPNRAMALLDMPASTDPLPAPGTVVMALEGIQDPGNMGTLIRIADWFGIPQIICSPDCVDVYNPKTIQATMGSLIRVRIAEYDIKTLLQQTSLPSYAATLHGKDITGYAVIREGIILIGNEGRGLTEEVMALATHRITIPRIGGAESLNAAVAAGIICGRLLI